MKSTGEFQNFDLLRKRCEETSRIAKRVVDDFLIGFAARHHDLEKKMNSDFARFRHVVSMFDRSHVDMFRSQYIAHNIFRKDGLIEKFMKNPALMRFAGEEREYLLRQTETPWHFSFAEIIGEPARDFFMMRDAFTGEEYLLFSPSTGRLNTRRSVLLWLNLIGFNGSCWQSYGPIGEFHSFSPDDIFFFATEKNSDIEDESEVQRDIENDPLPYMMLISGSAYPRTFHKEDELIVMMSEHDSPMPDTVKMRKQFITEYNDGVYKFTHKRLGKHPHFAQIFYIEAEKMLLFQTMTESGFKLLVRDFNITGFKIPVIPYLRVRLQMVTTAGSVLKKKIELNEYERLFHKDPHPAQTAHSKMMNEFLALVIPAINEGREPDIEAAIRKTGIDRETANEILTVILKQVGRVKGAGTSDKKRGNSGDETPKYSRPEKGNKKSTKTGKAGDERVNNPIEESGSEQLNKIYLAAKLISDLKPWEELFETDIFGVKMPGSGRTWYISVMGNNGEFTAISAYKDIEGLAGFYHMQENADTLSATTLFTIPHLMLSFSDRELLNREDLDAVRKSGVAFRGKGRWPKLEEIIPGFFPAFPENDTLTDLPILLEQVVWVLSSVSKKPGILYGKRDDVNQLLIRIPSGNPGKPVWKNHYETPETENFRVSYKATCKLTTSDAVSKLKSYGVTLQTDLILLPMPVKEQGKKGFFPFMLLLIDKSSGMVVGMNLLHPDPDLQSIYESVPQKLLEEILKLGYRPGVLEFRSELFLGISKTFLKQSGCTPVLVDHMPLIDEAIESLMEHMKK